MEKTENKKNDENKSQTGCCDFSSEDFSSMKKMMQNFFKGDEKESFDCCQMMKDMMGSSVDKEQKEKQTKK